MPKLYTLRALIFFLIVGINSFAQDYSGNDIRLVNKDISYYIDSGKNLPLQQIVNSKFIRSEKDILNFYNTNHRYIWVHFSFKNDTIKI